MQHLTKLYLSLLIALFTTMGVKAELSITELMQSNVTGIIDDLNDFPDSWVELYNSSSEPVNLSDYALGLKKKFDSAYPLPDRILQPGEYLVVFCDKAETGIHTSFRLESNKAGSVFLFKNGIQIQQVDHPEMPAPDIAYGINPLDQKWGYETAATPGAPNTGLFLESSALLSSPQFSCSGGLYSAPLALSITMPDGTPQGTTIHYTLDGSLPTADSPVLSDGQTLSIDKSTIVRARSICEGHLSPFPSTQSYIFAGRDFAMPVISIATDNDYFYGPDLGILYEDSENENWQNDWRRPINIEIFMPGESTSVANLLCETRLMGSYSRQSLQKSMNVYANKRFGTKRINTTGIWASKPNIESVKSLILRNSGNDFSMAHIRDAFVQELFGRNLTSLDYQAYRPSVVFINGVYHGIMDIRERSNEDFIEANYDGLEDIDMVENWNEVKVGSGAGLSDIILASNANPSDTENLLNLLDEGNVFDNLVLQFFGGNNDYITNNIVWWRPAAPDSKWRMLTKDVDLSFTKTCHQNNYYDYIDNFVNTTTSDWGRKRGVFFQVLLENPSLRDMFVDRMLVYSGTFLNQENALTFLSELEDEIDSEMNYHIQRWFENDPYTHAVWKKNISEYLPEYYKTRFGLMYEHIGNRIGAGMPLPLTISGANSETEISMNDILVMNSAFDGLFFQGRRLRLSATDDVRGWEISKKTSGNTDISKIDSNVCDIEMPACDRLTIRPLYSTDSILEIDCDTKDVSSDLYYDLQGRQVANHEITPGFYLKRSGSRTQKVLIK